MAAETDGQVNTNPTPTPKPPEERERRSRPREKPVDLSAMRERANRSANNAIATYSSRQLSVDAYGKLLVALVAVIAGILLMSMSEGRTVVYDLALATFGVAAVWALLFIVTWRRSAKELAANPPPEET